MRLPKTTLMMFLGASVFALFFITIFRWILRRWDLPDFVIPFVAILVAAGAFEVAGRLGPGTYTGPLTELSEETGRPMKVIIPVYVLSVLFVVLVIYTAIKLVLMLF
jgi:hypothetical protein